MFFPLWRIGGNPGVVVSGPKRKGTAKAVPFLNFPSISYFRESGELTRQISFGHKLLILKFLAALFTGNGLDSIFWAACKGCPFAPWYGERKDGAPGGS
jgi:hypothetical protein